MASAARVAEEKKSVRHVRNVRGRGSGNSNGDGNASGEGARGMTLIELLLTLGLLSMLLGLSLPGFGELLQRKRGDLAMGRLQGLVEFTRMSAVTAGREVTLCPSGDGRLCGGPWRRGALVFSNPAGAGQPDSSGPLRVLSFDGLPGRLLWRSFGNRQSLTFTPLGFTRNQNGSFTYCPDDGNLRNARVLVINRAGRVRRARDSNGDGMVEDSRGRVPRCD